MSEWKETHLSEVADIIPGFAFKSIHFGKNGYPVIKITDIRPPYIDILNAIKVDDSQYDRNRLKKYLIGKGDFVLAMTGATIGKVGKLIKNEMAYVNQRVAIVKPKQNTDKSFVYYCLHNNDFQDFIKNNIDSNSAQENISGTSIGRYEIMLPPLQEQKAIAGVLSSLDDKIDLLHRQNKTLEAMAETLFRQWFIVPCKYSNNEADLLEGFEFNSFKKWIETTIGGDWGKEFYEEDFPIEALCIRGTDIADLNSGIPEKVPLRFLKKNKFDKVALKNGDIVLEISGGTEKQSTGRTTYFSHELCNLLDYPFVFSNFCRMIRLKNSNYMYFVYLYLQYLYKQDEFFNLENGSSGIKNLNYKYLLFEQKFIMPNKELVCQFNENIKSLFHKIDTNKRRIILLKKLRDLLLPKLMSGEVRVESE